MGVLLVSEAPHSDGGPRVGIQKDGANGAHGAVTGVAAIGDPGAYHIGVGAVAVGEAAYRGEVALEVTAGDAKSGGKVGMLPDAFVELERRHDFRPVGADFLAQF